MITYEGLTATPDHLVWVEGKSEPIQLELAAASGAHLIQTGSGRAAIRLGESHQPRKAMECDDESLLCVDTMRGMWGNSMAKPEQPSVRKVKGMPKLFSSTANASMAEQKADGCKTTLRKSPRPRISKLWGAGHQVRVQQRVGGRTLPHRRIWDSLSSDGTGPDQHKRELHQGQSPLCRQSEQSSKSQKYSALGFPAEVLAIQPICGYEKIGARIDSEGHHPKRSTGCTRKAKELAHHFRTARLYDIRNAGQHHRFTVSGKLVHNCGYGGSVGALKAMGALEMGLTEGELQPLVNAWREANPNITRFWWDVDAAVKKAVKERTSVDSHGFRIQWQSGILFIGLPSGRQLSYVKPRIGENQFGSESVIYEGMNLGKWTRVESYGPKFTENIVQAVSRDILAYAMKTLRHCFIVGSVHDELIIECSPSIDLNVVCGQMGRTPPWVHGLHLRADGYECEFYKKE